MSYSVASFSRSGSLAGASETTGTDGAGSCAAPCGNNFKPAQLAAIGQAHRTRLIPTRSALRRMQLSSTNAAVGPACPQHGIDFLGKAGKREAVNR